MVPTLRGNPGQDMARLGRHAHADVRRLDVGTLNLCPVIREAADGYRCAQRHPTRRGNVN